MSKFKTKTKIQERLNIEARNLTFPDLVCDKTFLYRTRKKINVSSDQFHMLWEMPLHFLQIEQHLNILLTVSIAEKLDHNTS